MPLKHKHIAEDESANKEASVTEKSFAYIIL